MLKDCKEYAREVKNLGFTKYEFAEFLMKHNPQLPSEYIVDCLEAW